MINIGLVIIICTVLIIFSICSCGGCYIGTKSGLFLWGYEKSKSIVKGLIITFKVVFVLLIAFYIVVFASQRLMIMAGYKSKTTHYQH
jgi:hypothetical protein